MKVGDRVRVHTGGLHTEGVILEIDPPTYRVKSKLYPYLDLLLHEDALSPLPASRERPLGLPDKNCALPGCQKPNAHDAVTCWMCGNPV